MDLLVFLKQTGQIVVGFIRNGIFKENGSRRNDADDIALNESLCLLRIFKLLADGYFIPLLNQTVNINLGRMVRHAAHRNAAFCTCILPCQGQFQFMRSRVRVIIKQFVKITQTVKEQAVLVSLFYLFVLIH